MRHLALIASAVLCLATLGAGDAPQSKPARNALDRYSAAKAKLDADYQAKLQFLNRQLAGDLQTAMKSATKAGDLEEANAIKAILDKMFGVTRVFHIEAPKDWQPTIVVEKGQKIAITAEGEWCANKDNREKYACGPDGREDMGHLWYYLEGKIGDGPEFKVGSTMSCVAESAGTLSFRMKTGPRRTDGEGSLSVAVTVK